MIIYSYCPHKYCVCPLGREGSGGYSIIYNPYRCVLPQRKEIEKRMTHFKSRCVETDSPTFCVCCMHCFHDFVCSLCVINLYAEICVHTTPDPCTIINEMYHLSNLLVVFHGLDTVDNWWKAWLAQWACVHHLRPLQYAVKTERIFKIPGQGNFTKGWTNLFTNIIIWST